MPQHNPDVKKGKKMKKVNPPKKAGRASAPKRIKKPFRLEVGKTYATKQGHRAKVILEQGTYLPMRVEWLTGPKAGKIFWQDPNGLFWNAAEGGPTLNLIREVRQPKAPVARRAKGSPTTPKKGRRRV
jgi:hypothetical protein